MPGQFGNLERLFLIAWLVPFFGYFAFLFLASEPSLKPAATKRTVLKVYSSTDHYRELEKPAEFGFEQLASVVNYLLLASAGILAFVSKTLTESPSASSTTGTAIVRRTRTELLLQLHGGIACFFSMSCGVCAYLSLPDITVVETFAVTGFLSRCVVGQIAGLLFAVLLLLVALGGMVRDQLP